MKPDAERPFLIRLARAFGYAAHGVALASRDRMFRCQLLLGGLACGLGAWLKLTPVEWAILAIAITSVLSLEVLNTAVESVVDLVSPDAHPLAKHAKDAAAGAVLIASGGAVVVGAFLFLPRLLQ